MSKRRTAVDPTISSWHFTATSDDRIRSLQMQQSQQTATDQSDDENPADGFFSAHESFPVTATRLIEDSCKAFRNGEHAKALELANESLDRDNTCDGLFCRGRALIGMAKYGQAETAFIQALDRADDSLTPLIERELRHLRYNALKSMNLKDSDGQQWDNPIEAIRISRSEKTLNEAISRYNRLTEPNTIAWNTSQETEQTMRWNIPHEPFISESPSLPLEPFSRNSPDMISSPILVLPPPGFSESLVNQNVRSSPGPIQRPIPAAAVQPMPVKPVGKTAAQLLASNGDQWKTTTGLKGKNKKSGDADLPTNVFDCEGIWIGGLNRKRTESEVLELFKPFGTIRANRMGQSTDANYMFISYDARTPPAKAVKQMNGSFPQKFTINSESPLIVRFEPSQNQRPIYATWTLEKTRKMAYSKGECYAWRTKDGCHSLSDCPYSHQERNRGVDSVSWLTKAKK